MKTRLLVVLAALLGAVSARPSCRAAPPRQGISSPAVLTFVEAVDKLDALNSFMLVRHGHVVAEGWWSPYRAEAPHSLYSLSKSFTSTAVGLAIAEGKLSVDDAVLKFFPDDAPAEPSDNLKAMRVSDLLRMSTGHQTEPPRTPDAAVDENVPGPPGSLQARNPFSLQHVGNLHAVGHRPESDGTDRARLFAAAAFRTAGH